MRGEGGVFLLKAIGNGLFMGCVCCFAGLFSESHKITKYDGRSSDSSLSDAFPVTFYCFSPVARCRILPFRGGNSQQRELLPILTAFPFNRLFLSFWTDTNRLLIVSLHDAFRVGL